MKNRTLEPFISWIRGIDVGDHHPVGVEVGVKRGRTSAGLLHAIPDLELFMVDPWHPDGDTQYGWSRDEHFLHHQEAIKATEFAWYRRHVLAMDCATAAFAVSGLVQFVILDADHSDVFDSIRLWAIDVWSQPGGWIGGRHILNRDLSPVRGKQNVLDGVHKYMAQFGDACDLEVDGTSWRIKWKGCPDDSND